jgi:hypothetical protein
MMHIAMTRRIAGIGKAMKVIVPRMIPASPVRRIRRLAWMFSRPRLSQHGLKTAKRKTTSVNTAPEPMIPLMTAVATVARTPGGGLIMPGSAIAKTPRMTKLGSARVAIMNLTSGVMTGGYVFGSVECTLMNDIALHAVLIWFAVMFFTTTETRAMIGWATGFLFITIFIVAMKIWFWMQMEKYVVLRELKRLEAQVARLVEASHENR